MVKAFKELGHEVDIVALVQVEGKGSKKLRGGYWAWIAKFIPHWVYEVMSLGYNVYGYAILHRAIALKKPDLIYERYALNTFCGIWASRRFGIPLLLEVNAPLYYEQASLGRLVFQRFAQYAERWICSNSTSTIVVSHVMKEFLIRNGVCADRISVIPNAIDSSKFHPRVSGSVVRQQYGLENTLVIGFVGWFRKWHGLEMLLNIMREAEFTRLGVRLLLVGDGPAFADLYRFAKDHDILRLVVFTGPVARDRIPEHIAAMDIAIQPSVTEYACPIKIIEYMGMGKCIVAPNQPNIRELLKDGINSLLFKPANDEDFKTVLIRAVENREVHKRLGDNAYQTLRERKYFWSANADRALNLI
jgi:glycosyltransferase involved in cell wall biosynthesis